MKKIKNISAIILAGGFGTRIKSVDDSIPKSLIKVGKYNLLEHNILELKEMGIIKFIISIG